MVRAMLKHAPGIQATHNKKVAQKHYHPPEQVQNIKRQKGKKLWTNRLRRVWGVLWPKVPASKRDSPRRLDLGRPLLGYLPEKRQVLHFQRQQSERDRKNMQQKRLHSHIQRCVINFELYSWFYQCVFCIQKFILYVIRIYRGNESK